MYADDTIIYCAGKNPADIVHNLNHDLSSMKQWLDNNKLSLNVNKTKFIMLGTQQRLARIDDDVLNVHINGDVIERVFSCTHLGIIIDSNLNWHEHINNLLKKSARSLSMIRRAKSLVPQSALKLIYNSIVAPNFNYCDIIWGNCTKTDSIKLQRMQARAARYICNVPWDTPGSEVLNQLSWLKLAEIRNIHLAEFMFRVTNNLLPDNICMLFEKKEYNYNLRRNPNNVDIPFPSNNFKKRSLSYRGAHLWNDLSAEAQSCDRPTAFRKLLYCNYELNFA